MNFSLKIISSAVRYCVVCTLLLSGCGGPLFGEAKRVDSTPEHIALQGLEDFRHGDYYGALKKFDTIKDRYPFSNVSLLAELKAADSHFYMKHYQEARNLYEEFENNHPTNEAVPYVIFQTGMCHFRQMDTIDRDTTAAVNAIEAFSRLVKMFPESPYVVEARERIKLARNFLAEHEFYVATFYLRTNKYEQAKGRLEYLLSSYPEAEISGEAQKLLTSLKNDTFEGRSWRSWLPFMAKPY